MGAAANDAGMTQSDGSFRLEALQAHQNALLVDIHRNATIALARGERGALMATTAIGARRLRPKPLTA
ncbi:hypothetical protein [Metallibacterium scheffleri]|uniref:hypothetical protein n=1 Tax=Metallibacterium scheffleri TaxID=993689 RepID=UPI00109F4489|nr:hypothetical protein [Metallibacterium scheffleri]